MNNFAYPNGFPNNASFDGVYDNVENYKSILIDYNSNVTDTLTISYSNDTITSVYTVTYQISKRQLVLNPVYSFFKIDATGGPGSRYCKCTYMTKFITEFSKISAPGQNNLLVNVNGSNSAFGDILTTKMKQIANNTFIYGLNSMNSYVQGTGSVTNNNNLLTVSAGLNAMAGANSNQYTNYSPGIGVMLRFTASFTNNNSTLMIGAGTPSCGLYFGYTANNFSIMTVTAAYRQIVWLLITNRSRSADPLILTLDNVVYSIPMVNATFTLTANIIANYNYNTVYPGWTASLSTINGNKIIEFISSVSGNRNGIYLASGNNAVVEFLTFYNNISTGSDGVVNIIQQQDWNINTVNTLDPSKGNVYWIKYQYLGFGQIMFGVEDNNTGKLIPVHAIKYTNTQTSVSLSNPSMPFSMYAMNGSLSCGSYSMFIEGNPGIPLIVKNYTLTMTSRLFFSLRNKTVYNNMVNQCMAVPISMNVSNDSNASIILHISINCVLNLSNFTSNASTNTIIEIDTSSTSFSSGTKILTVFVTKQQIIDLRKYNFVWSPGTIITISATTNATIRDINVSIQWAEYQ